MWGWRGAVIEKLGLLHITFERTTLEYCAAAPDPCTGDINSSKWTNEDGEVGSNLDLATQAVTFQFRANAPGAERVLAQISSQPFTTEYEPNPAYLIEADPITGTASNGSLHGEFTI